MVRFTFCSWWVRLLVVCVSVGLAGAQSFAEFGLADRPLLKASVVVVCDNSAASTCTPSTLTVVSRQAIRSLASGQGVIRWYRLDDVQAAVLVAKYVAMPPVRESRAALAAHERQIVAEAEALLSGVGKRIFSCQPRTSPLTTAVPLIALNAREAEHETILYVITDGREAAPHFGANWEQGVLPSPVEWAQRVQRAGLYTKSSLQGVTIHFVAMNPMQPAEGQRSASNLQRGLQLRELWRSLITSAGGTVTFSSEDRAMNSTPAVPLWGALFFVGSSLLWWRKQRVKFRAWRDRKRGWYAPAAIIKELLGVMPGLDPSDPEHEHALLRIQQLRVLVEDVKARLLAVREDLTRHVRWGMLAGGTVAWANNAWYDKIRPTLTKLDLGWVNYQVLRRSAVTLLNATGADGTIVAAQCGHGVDTSTNVYNKVGLDRQLAAVQTLDNAINATKCPAA